LPPAFQLRRYAWSAKLPLSILTDFEEFAVYDCLFKPIKTDKASTARMLYYNYKDYTDKWEEISSIFSREAILKGSFDKYIDSGKKKRGTAEVDSAFLKEIESWRENLAQNIAIRNPKLSQRGINFSVQKIIDRIIFLRISEDRGLETNTLREIGNKTKVYTLLCELFLKADKRYNSGLFHFKSEKDIATHPDELTLTIKLDDAPLKSIIKNLYYPDSPYEFSVLPPDILGHVYEQFLGKVIRLDDSHRAIIEEKPEVRKAGGVYYTPTYIVDYIVKNTVGKLLDGKTTKQAEKLKILDPACGSGSFLIEAYQYLLDWHLEKYLMEMFDKTIAEMSKKLKISLTKENNEQAERLKKQIENYNKKRIKMFRGRYYDLKMAFGKNIKIPKTENQALKSGKKRSAIRPTDKGGWCLTLNEKKRILLNHVYGVDIDNQAVEVTKLSLLLKILEGESQSEFLGERVLPDLGNNIKCGNSLICPDFYEKKSMDLFDEKERYRINVFDWKSEFPEILSGKNPGFNAVIGNPPYIGFHGFKKEKEYFSGKYNSAKGKYDIYVLFIERVSKLINNKGVMSYICPTAFMKRKHGLHIRSYILKNLAIQCIIDFEHKRIFKDALNYTGIFIFSKLATSNNKIDYKQGFDGESFSVNQNDLSDNLWIIKNPEQESIIKKIESNPHISKLIDFTGKISEGIVTGLNDIYLLSNQFIETNNIETEFLKKCLRGKNIRRYYLENLTEYVFYPYNSNNELINENDIKTRCPNYYRLLVNSKDRIHSRQYFNKSKKMWYELWNQRKIVNFESYKIIVPELADKNRFMLDSEQLYYGDTVCGFYLKSGIEIDLHYILGLLNSKLVEYFHKKTSVPKTNNYFIYKTKFLKEIPIRNINFNDIEDKKRHKQIIELVEQMLQLHKQLAEAKTSPEKTAIQRQIDATDNQIDQLVYNLYDLTPAEIKIIENANI